MTKIIKGYEIKPGADLRKADLGRANLYGARLKGANLGRADLREANLTRADLEGAYLTEADLRGANLGGANLGGANLKEADLEGMIIDDGTDHETGELRTYVIGYKMEEEDYKEKSGLVKRIEGLSEESNKILPKVNEVVEHLNQYNQEHLYKILNDYFSHISESFITFNYDEKIEVLRTLEDIFTVYPKNTRSENTSNSLMRRKKYYHYDGKIAREIREEMKYSQTALAEELNLSLRNLSRWEFNESQPSHGKGVTRYMEWLKERGYRIRSKHLELEIIENENNDY